MGEKIIRSTNESAALVYELIDKHQINCFASRKGFLQPAFSTKSCQLLADRVEQINAYGGGVELLDRQTTREYLGTDCYHTSLLDPRGGALQPLSYARGLAHAAIQQGARVFTHSLVTSITRTQDGWQAITPPARIKSNKVLICTNAYTKVIKGMNVDAALKQSVIPYTVFKLPRNH